jgi:hypothetical protein
MGKNVTWQRLLPGLKISGYPFVIPFRYLLSPNNIFPL